MKKLTKKIAVLCLVMLALTCGKKEDKTKTIRIGSVVSEEHPSNQSIMYFAKIIEEQSGGHYKFELFPNSVLGSEREMIEQVQQGILDIVKGGSPLNVFYYAYEVIGLPYVFDSDEHFYRVMENEKFDKMAFKDSADKGFVTLTYLDKGARSFYTKSKPIIVPDDLKGLKIRAVNEPISMRVIELLGGNPTPMAYGEVYTALQQGVIDGAESDITVLNIGKHGEVAKAFSFDNHQRLPDFITVSSKFWNTLSAEDKNMFQDAANQARDKQKELWKEVDEKAREDAKAMGVKFYDAKEELFREKVSPIIEEQKKLSAEKKGLIEFIESLR